MYHHKGVGLAVGAGVVTEYMNQQLAQLKARPKPVKYAQFSFTPSVSNRFLTVVINLQSISLQFFVSWCRN